MNGTLHGLKVALYIVHLSPARIPSKIRLETFHTDDVKLYTHDLCLLLLIGVRQSKQGLWVWWELNSQHYSHGGSIEEAMFNALGTASGRLSSSAGHETLPC